MESLKNLFNKKAEANAGNSEYEVHTDILKSDHIACDKDRGRISDKYAYELFELESVSWDYIDSICLDVRDGKPYLEHSQQRNRGAAYYTVTDYSPITYDELKRYAQKKGYYETYCDINESNWKKFIPAEKLKGEPSNRKHIPLCHCDTSGIFDIDEFYFSQLGNLSSNITYLRRCDTGYRVFYVFNESYSFVSDFFNEFTKTEEQIRELLEGKHIPTYSAFDRLLSDKELQYITYLFKNIDEINKSLPKQTFMVYKDIRGNIIKYTVYKTVKGKKISCPTSKYSLIQEALAHIARYGSIFSRECE
ncbi:MAG: hypothetical protein J1F63_02195 [Oscillospiraceae bacterium]|nr:hypothetical protein [Oscillospiraceae bacterium]